MRKRQEKTIAHKRTRRSPLFAGIAVVLAATVAITAYAVSKTIKTATNTFTPDTITLAVIEAVKDSNGSSVTAEKSVSLAWGDEADGTRTAEKPVTIQNVDNADENNADAYIRVCLVPKWTAEVTSSADGSTYAVDVMGESYQLTSFGSMTEIHENASGLDEFTMGLVTFTLAENWSEKWFYNPTDGYFYYKESVAPNEETTQLLSSVTISADTYQILQTNDIQLEVDVLADGIQTKGGALETRWAEDTGIVIADGVLQTTTAGGGD